MVNRDPRDQEALDQWVGGWGVAPSFNRVAKQLRSSLQKLKHNTEKLCPNIFQFQL